MLSLSLLDDPGWAQKDNLQFLATMNNFLSELTVYINSQKMESQHVQSHAMQQTNLNILSRSDNRIGEYLNKYIVAIYDECCKDGSSSSSPDYNELSTTYFYMILYTYFLFLIRSQFLRRSWSLLSMDPIISATIFISIKKYH